MNKRLIRIIIGSILFVLGIIIKTEIDWINFIFFITSYIIIGGDVVFKAVKNIFKGKVFDENFLMSVATIGAFCISEFPEAVAVMLFYQVGELFQSYAVNKSRKSIASLMDIRPDYANLKLDNEIIKKDPNEINIGDIIVVKPGEKIPLDGILVEGTTNIDTSALTGESVPREAVVGDNVLSGCININGLISIKVTKKFGESTVSKILDLVENASNKKSNSENFITKFARVYTPIVVFIALILAVIPPLVIKDATFSVWVYRALSFLVVSCPCALVISIPLSFFGGIGGSSRKGILVKGSNYLEALARTETIVFDKTGTLTKGVFKVQSVKSIGISDEELIEITAHAESNSSHPISSSLIEFYGKEIDNSKVENIEEISGHGVKALINKKEVLVGNSKLMQKMNIEYSKDEIIGTVVHVAINGTYAGYIVISDELKDDSKNAILQLKKFGIKRLAMLTGDSKTVGEKIGNELGMDEIYSELLPGDKVEKLENLLENSNHKGKLVFVGDGINDAPVLSRADIGIAMGGLGSDAAIEAADIVIMTDEPSKILTAIKISKKTLKIAKQNIVFAISVKVLVLILAAAGISTMWEAVFADVGVSVLAILNSFRALNPKV